MCDDVVSSTASSKSARQGRGKRLNEEVTRDDSTPLGTDSVLEIPPEMSQMLQTFSRELNRLFSLL